MKKKTLFSFMWMEICRLKMTRKSFQSWLNQCHFGPRSNQEKNSEKERRTFQEDNRRLVPTFTSVVRDTKISGHNEGPIKVSHEPFGIIQLLG